MRSAKKKKNGGFGRGLFLFVLGATCGMGGAAGLTAYTNELYIPFIEPPTRAPGVSGEQIRKESEEQALQFREVLRSRQPQPAQVELPEDGNAPAAASRISYYLQIGAYRDEAAAESVRGKIALLGRDAVIRAGQTADEKALYRVWVGPYDNENKAEAERAALVLEGYGNISLLRTTEQ